MDDRRETELRGPLDAELLEALRHLGAGILTNAVERLRDGPHNEGFVDHTVRCLCPEPEPMVGYAATVRVRGSASPTAGRSYADCTDWWEYIASVPAPRVAVVQDVGARPGLASLVGEVDMHVLRALQCVGVVTNGAVRDLPAAESAPFHYFAANLAVPRAHVHIVEIGQPVEIGGLKISSGDLLHGDRHGVQSIPLRLAPRIPAVAAEIAAQEAALIALCRAPDFSLARLRAAVAEA